MSMVDGVKLIININTLLLKKAFDSNQTPLLENCTRMAKMVIY